MSEPMTTRFEADLTAALGAYAEGAPMAVDPVAVARAAAATGPRPRLAPARTTWRALRPALLLAALLALLIAMLLASGAFPSPFPRQPARSRLMVSDGVTTWIVGPDRTVLATGHPELPRSGGSCWLIGGTNIVMGNDFTTWAFASLTDEPLPVVTATANFGGGERWSPDRTRVALVRVTDGLVTVLDFRDPSTPAEKTLEMPGLIGAGWMPTSDGVVVARRLESGAVTVQRFGLDGSTGVAQTVDIGPWVGGAAESEMIELAVSPDGHSVALLGVRPDATTADPSPSPWDGPLPILADGELRVLGPLPYGTAAWDPTSRRLAWIEDTATVVADVTGHTRADWGRPLFGPLGWLPGGWLVAAGGDRIMVSDGNGSRDGVLLDSATNRLWAVDGDRVVDVHVIDGVLSVRWYRADGTVDGPDLALTDPDRASTDAPSCLDVQPLPD